MKNVLTEKNVINVFCDESRQDLLVSTKSLADCNKYCCIGGIAVPSALRESVKNDIKAIRQKHSVFGELKWGTVSLSKIDFYIELVDYFFCNPDLSFRTVVIDSSKIKNDIYNCADHELGYYKFYYQLLFHWLDIDYLYRIYTDQKTNSDRMRLRELRRILNNSCSSFNPVISIQSIDSNESNILQLENILMGAVGYKYNFGNNGMSKAKETIISRIEHYIDGEIKPTSKNEAKFNIFEIALRGGQE